MNTFEEDLEEVQSRNTEKEERPVGRPEYVVYLGVGDLPPREAMEYVKQYREKLAPLFGGRSVYIPVRGKSDSRIELLQPTPLQKRAWDLYVGTLTKYGDLLSLARGEIGDQTYRDLNYASVTESSPIRKKLAQLAFAAAKDFSEIEAQEMKMISKPCPECGGLGEIEGLSASAVEE